MTWLNRIISRFIEPNKLFYIGQQITPKTDVKWWCIEFQSNVNHLCPKRGEIVEVIEYLKIIEGEWYIRIAGYAHKSFNENCFAPVITDDQLEEMLNDIDELIVKEHVS
jgi:hypothetical protein